ncbi:MAG: family 78 glycoside hydrolase catalytic domain, partial [Bacteroidota bacterium]|nr:family 78 glycoside hydrolase catalytic domain [Bacteroidota bacterium]
EFRVLYLSYDLKEKLRKGENVLGAILGNGFFNAAVNWTMPYGSPRFLAQLQITYTDGSEQTIVSDETWKAHKSAIVTDQIYGGEHYDARLELPGWCSPKFNDSDWQPVAIRKAPEGKLMAQMSHSDKVMERLKPVKIEKLGDGHYKVDFGQEIAGWLRLIKVQGEAGRKIDIKYLSESPNGANSYTLKGGAPESYSTRFTWYVFRAVEVVNWPGELKPEQIEADAVYTQNKTTGHFKCSNELFNKINQIWWRSQSDNMHGGVASDCPHRERSAYTGDGQASCVTVMHNFDAAAFYTKWIRDIVGAQDPKTGYVPNAAPFQPGCGGGVPWGAAIDIMPWEFYLHYGDKDILENSFDGMKGYVDYMLTWVDENGIMFQQLPKKEAPNYWLNLGDWCPPGDFPANDLVHTFYLWRCADFTAKAAKVLNKPEDEARYSTLAERTRQAFHRKFYNPEKCTYGAFGGNIFALKMNLPEKDKDKVVASLKQDIIKNKGHLDTGIFGTQFFFEVLAENGLNDLAYEAMNKRDFPSFGHWIEQGATTTWEEWGGNNSHNHPMFGGSLTWFYRKLAGLNADPNQPGYRHIIFRPQPVDSIASASYSNMTPYGLASIDWTKKDGKFSMKVAVPIGSTATVYVPVVLGTDIKESGKKINEVKDISSLGISNGYAVYKVNSGKYQFEAN